MRYFGYVLVGLLVVTKDAIKLALKNLVSIIRSILK